MNSDTLARLFQPFQQGDTTISRHYGGTGLGLSISKRLADRLGASIAVESQPGVGTTFTLRVPIGEVDGRDLVTPEAPATAARENERPEQDNARPWPRIHGRILVVDDQPDVRTANRLALEAAGATVTVAEHGQQAVELVTAGEGPQSDPFDVILLDMQMPIKSGFEAARELRQQGCKRPIIALTARAMKGERERCLRAGCDDYLAKPTDARALLQKVAEHLESGSRAPVKRVVVVDDHADTTVAMAQLLRAWGYGVRTAANGREARRVIEGFKPHVCLLDNGLPDMTGVDLMQALKGHAELADMVFVAVTGETESQRVERLIEAGFDHYMAKPVDFQALRTLLEAL